MAIIGFIGLGNMGAPMAANLVKAGHRVIGYDINTNAVQALASAGVEQARSAADATRGADVVITMLPAGEHVREVWLHQGGLIDAVNGTTPLLIDCSTIDVDSARTVTEAARRRGPGDARCAGVGRHRRRHRGDADLHGRRQRDRVRARAAGAAGDGQEHRPCRRTGCGAGGEDLQQHDARHQHGGRVGRLPAGTQAGPGLGQAAPDRLDLVRAILGAVELLPGARPGARGAVQPRLCGGLHGGTDAEGREAVAGGGGCGRVRRRRSPRMRCRSTRPSSMPATAARISPWCSAGWKRSHGNKGATMGAEAFKAARDFLFAHRTDYAARMRDSAGRNWSISTTRSTGSTPNWRAASSANCLALKIVGDGAASATFAELSERSNRVANGLRALGVKRGERILLMLGNVVPLWEVMLAAMKLGAVVIPATTLLTPSDLKDRFERGRVRHLIANAADAPKFAGLDPDGDPHRGRRCACRLAWLRGAAARRCALRTRWRDARHRSDAAVFHLRHDVAAEAGGAQPPELSGRAPDHDVLDRLAAGRHASEHLLARLGETRL